MCELAGIIVLDQMYLQFRVSSFGSRVSDFGLMIVDVGFYLAFLETLNLKLETSSASPVGCFICWTGRMTIKAAPCPGVLFAVMVPP